MKIFLIIAGHLLIGGIVIFCGVLLNDKINQEYAGVITVVSIGISLYTIIFNYLYQRTQRVHLFVNRILLKCKRSHTYWQPHFHFISPGFETDKIFYNLWTTISSNPFGAATKIHETANTLRIAVDNLFVLSFRAAENEITLAFEHKLLVPTHLYSEYIQRLSRMAEEIRNTINPKKALYSIIVSFEPNHKNPYYGFFVNRVSPDLIQCFNVAFRLNSFSDCRIEAGKDEIDISGKNLTDTFKGLDQVLSLRALPKGTVQ